jgi:hypothetical protein
MIPETIPTPLREQPRPGRMLLVFAVIAVLLAMLINFRNELASTRNISAALGGAASAFVIAVLVALLFSIAPIFRNPRSRTKVVLWTSVLLFGAGLVRMAGGLATELEQVANGINASAPKLVDAGTRLEGAVAGPGPLLTIRETLIAVDGRQVDRNAWNSRVVPNIRSTALQNASLRRLLSSGVVVTFRYKGRDGAFVDDVTLTGQDLLVK